MLRIFWFRKDLRIEDNYGLYNFLNEIEADDEYLFLYIKNENSFKYFGEKRINFLFECLKDLKEEIEKVSLRLNIVEGNSYDVLSRIAKNRKDVIVYANDQPEPYSRKRDKRVSKHFELKLYTDSTIFDLGYVTKENSEPYVVFTPFSNKFFELISDEQYKRYNTVLKRLDRKKEYSIEDIEPTDPKKELKRFSDKGIFNGGRIEGLKILKRFYEKRLDSYRSRRDIPSEQGTSNLSPHLHFGTIGIREAFRTGYIKLAKAKGNDKTEVQTWLKELAWREFYYNISYFFPKIEMESFRKEYDGLAWNDDEKMFKAWCEGKTGYPIVDAGMRQLNKDGWMHNRIRMITASFLTKHLLIDWRKGERYFADKLIDMDFSSNNGGWQWSASTGVDAQPYFRIFNPVLQSKKFDPEGKYIKKYVPELAKIDKKYVHSPWEMKEELQKYFVITIGKDYPKPIVDHKAAREIVLKEFKRISK